MTASHLVKGQIPHILFIYTITVFTVLAYLLKILSSSHKNKEETHCWST